MMQTRRALHVVTALRLLIEAGIVVTLIAPAPGFAAVTKRSYVADHCPYAVCSWLAECSYTVFLPDGGAFFSLIASIDGNGALHSRNKSCSLTDEAKLAGATLSTGSEPSIRILGFAEDLPPGTALLRCTHSEVIEYDDRKVSRTFGDVAAWSDEAGDSRGHPVPLPRLCIANFDCDPTLNLDFKGVPRCGDANYDEKVSAIDALAALLTSVEIPSCSPFAASCDANGDGTVGSSDALLILRSAVEAPVSFSCPVPCNEKWQFVVSIFVDPLEDSDLFMRVVPREGSRFVQRSVPPSTEVSYPGDGSANVRVFASGDEFELAILLLATEGYRPTAEDFQIEVEDGAGMPIEGAIAHFDITGPYFASVR